MTSAADAPAAPRRTRPFYWSVRRELWEHRAIWIAPLAVAAVALFGFLIGTHHLPQVVRLAATRAGAATGAEAIVIPYYFVAFAVVMTGLIVAVFYCLGALHNERRDRSVLFWKSLPVSDLTTVLSKAAVPILLLPPIQFAVILGAHVVMAAFSSLVVTAAGLDPNLLWAHTPVPLLWLKLAGGLPFIALWYAPLYAWLILVSVWARRAPFLWALAPPLVLALVEQLALGTHVVWSWLTLRMIGIFSGAFNAGEHAKAAVHHTHELDAASWGSPHLWIGLAIAAALLAAAVRLRRSRDPI